MEIGSPPKLGGVAARTKSEQTGWFQKGTTPPRSARPPPNLGGELLIRIARTTPFMIRIDVHKKGEPNMANQTRREILKGGLALAGLSVFGVPEWALPALAEGETLVPFTD